MSLEINYKGDQIAQLTEDGTVTLKTAGKYVEGDIEAVYSGGESVGLSDVNFYDYDGTLVASYTAADFAALTALPENPTHEGLTAQGWNWSLADAKAYVAEYGKLEIGQMYVTDDGKTRIHIRLEDGRLAPYLGIAINGTATVEWGDGTTSTVTGRSTSTIVSTRHTYASAGEYVVAIAVIGSMALLGDVTYYSRVLWKNADKNNSTVYRNAIQKVEIGAKTSMGQFAFASCNSLTLVTIPSSVTSIGQLAFDSCYSLASVTIPSSVTSIGEKAFDGCYSLTSVTIPSSVTSIGGQAFYGCYGLTSITIPDGELTIDSEVFSYCYSLKSITIPPTSNIVSYLAESCRSLFLVTIGNRVTSIDPYTFYFCETLHHVAIPDSVNVIREYAFASCYSLASVTIPSSVTSIQGNAFSNCRGLGFIKFSSSNPPTVVSSNAWNNVPTDCIIYVPRGSISAYKSATNYPSSSTYTYIEY